MLWGHTKVSPYYPFIQTFVLTYMDIFLLLMKRWHRFEAI